MKRYIASLVRVNPPPVVREPVVDLDKRDAVPLTNGAEARSGFSVPRRKYSEQRGTSGN